MKILYMMTEPFGVGGVQSDILTLSEDLLQRGHDIHVATAEGVLLDELKGKGARHVDIDFHYHGFIGLLRSAMALRRAVRERGIELVAPQSVRSSIVAFVALRLLPFGYRVASTARRLPIVTTIHNIHNPKHFGYAGYILRVCADYVIFESHYERDRLLTGGLPAERSCVIHSGIDTDRFVPCERDPALAARYGLDLHRDKVFGIVARLSEEKGHCYLIDAFARVREAIPNARLLIIGDGPLRQDIEAQIQRLGLTDCVVLTGMQRNIPAYLAVLDVFVLASTRESFPLAAREAMAAGKAVIAPRIGGCPEVVDEGVTGYLFESRDVGQLADCMTRLVMERHYLIFGPAGRQRVERLFSRRSWVDGDERVYLRMHAQSI